MRELNNFPKVMIIEPLGNGGIAHYTFNLFKALKEERCKVILATSSSYELEKHTDACTVIKVFFKIASKVIKLKPEIEKETSIPTLIRRVLRVIEYPFNTVKCIKIANREKIEIVHLQVIHLIDLIMFALFRVFGYKIVATVHNVNPLHKPVSKFALPIYRLLYNNFNLLILHAEISKKEFCEIYKVQDSKITFIHHGNYGFFAPNRLPTKTESMTEIGVSITSKVVLFFGAIRENKGLTELLYAWPDIRISMRNAVLVIAGEAKGNYKCYKEIIKTLMISDSVKEYIQYIPIWDVHKFFCAADVVVLPYKEVSQSGVLQIAFAFGVPVVATEVGGFKEAIQNEFNGLLVPIGSKEILSQSIIRLLSDHGLANRIARNSKILANTLYSWSNIARESVLAYEKVREGKRI